MVGVSRDVKKSKAEPSGSVASKRRPAEGGILVFYASRHRFATRADFLQMARSLHCYPLRCVSFTNIIEEYDHERQRR